MCLGDWEVSEIAPEKPTERPAPRPKTRRIPLKEILPLEKLRLKTGQKTIEVENMVQIPAELVAFVEKRLNKCSTSLNEKILSNILPLLISYKASTSYVGAVMQDGLGIELAFEDGLFDSVKHLGYIAVLYHFVRNLKLPRDTKRQFMRQLTQEVATKSITALFSKEKSSAQSRLMSELHAYVASKNPEKDATDGVISNGVGTSRRRK
jgi:hypothetical protein